MICIKYFIVLIFIFYASCSKESKDNHVLHERSLMRSTQFIANQNDLLLNRIVEEVQKLGSRPSHVQILNDIDFLFRNRPKGLAFDSIHLTIDESLGYVVLLDSIMDMHETTLEELDLIKDEFLDLLGFKSSRVDQLNAKSNFYILENRFLHSIFDQVFDGHNWIENYVMRFSKKDTYYLGDTVESVFCPFREVYSYAYKVESVSVDLSYDSKSVTGFDARKIGNAIYFSFIPKKTGKYILFCSFHIHEKVANRDVSKGNYIEFEVK